MAGLYLHIPFCAQACTYCNFHFTTGKQHLADIVPALIEEMKFQSDFFKGTAASTIYFGGGTPSILPATEIATLVNTAKAIFGSAPDAEITLEANPEDINPENLEIWQKAGINRLSIGIQTLDDAELQQMNRIHTAEEGVHAVELALKSGIHSVNVDLTFGSQWLSDEQWDMNMDWAFSCGADHISAYGLTVEEKTLLAKKVNQGQIPKIDEEKQARQYQKLAEKAKALSWEFYEISNLSKPGHRAKHNSNYWKNLPYLGIGPSAHSFRNNVRHWNVSDNLAYIKMSQTGQWKYESEALGPENLLNEYLMTHLRMVEGIDLDACEVLNPGFSKLHANTIAGWIQQGFATQNQSQICLTTKGRLVCDFLTTQVMV